jgi:hypothetical protein
LSLDDKRDVRKIILDELAFRFRTDPHCSTSDFRISRMFFPDRDQEIIVSEMKLMLADELLEVGYPLYTTEGASFYKISKKGIEAVDTTYNEEWKEFLEKMADIQGSRKGN